MDLTNVTKIVNILVGAFVVLGGFFQIFPLGIHSVLGIFTILFGIAIAALEFNKPPQVAEFARFLYTFFGRGLFYALLAFVIISGGVISTLLGILVLLVGIAYIAASYVSYIEVPSNMKPDGYEDDLEQI